MLDRTPVSALVLKKAQHALITLVAHSARLLLSAGYAVAMGGSGGNPCNSLIWAFRLSISILFSA